MNPNNYPPINVLNIVRGFNRSELKYPITPYRFEKRNGDTVKISQVRHFHKERKGKGLHYHFVVRDEENSYYHICLDTNTYTWFLLEEKVEGIDESLKRGKKLI